jgi:UDP-N-acetylmuramate-alanine ligase
VERLVKEARPGDVILTLGAGDVTRLGEKIVARLGGGA